MCMHFEVLRIKLKKVISELLSRVKALEDLLKPIYMMKSTSLWVLELDKVQDNKVLQKKTYQRQQREHPTSEWSYIRVYIKMMKEHDYDNRNL